MSNSNNDSKGNSRKQKQGQRRSTKSDHAEMLADVLEVLSFLDHADYWDGENGDGFEDLPELPDLRELSIHDLIQAANDTADLLCRLAPVMDRDGDRHEVEAVMEQWARDTADRFDAPHRRLVGTLADWVIRIQAVMEEVTSAA